MTKKKRSGPAPLRPLSKQEVAAIFTRFVRGDIRVGEEEGLAKRLRAGRDIAVPFLMERLGRGTRSEQDVASYLLCAVGGREVKESLLKVTSDTNIADRAKAMAMTTLAQLGEEVNYNAFLDQLADPERFSLEVMNEVLATATVDEGALEATVRDIERMPADARAKMIHAIGHVGDPRTLRLLLPLLYGRENRTILAAIDALETLGRPEAVPALTELSLVSPQPEVRGRARSVYGKLAVTAVSSGIPGREQSRLPPQELPLFKAMVCTVDGDGAESVLVGRKRSNGRFKAVCILFNDHQGIKDCFGGDMLTKNEWNSIASSLEKEGLSWVDIGLPQCRRLVAEARVINQRVRRKPPLELEIWGTLLEDGPEAARLWKDDEEETTICSERVMEPELLRRSHELLELREFRSWGFDPRDMEPFALMTFEALRRSRASKRHKAESLNLAIANMVKGLVKPRLRVLLEGRLRRQAWLLKKLGRPEHSRLAVAAATGVGPKSGIPVEEQPLLRGMAMKSLFEMASVFEDYMEQLPSQADRMPAVERGGGDKGRVGGLYRFRVSLKGMPGIWRTIEIKGDQTLDALHKAIFSAFDRDDEHLYAFYLSNKAGDAATEYGSPHSDGGIGRNTSRARIDSLGLRPRQRFLYIFDFGDNWEHTIEVMEIREAVPAGRYPRIIEKKGDSPPQYPEEDELNS